MQRPKQLEKPGLVLQAYINQPLDFFKQAEKSRKRPHMLDKSIIKRSQVRTSLAKTDKKHNYFISTQEINQLSAIPFKNNTITQKMIDSIFVDKLSDNLSHQDYFNNATLGLKPLFKIKKRKNFPRRQGLEDQMTESIRNATITQNLRKNPVKMLIQTSFHKSYKTSLQQKKIRYKQKLQNNPEELQFDVLINRIQNTALLGKYALKHIKVGQNDYS